MSLVPSEDWPPRRCCSGESCNQGRAECQTPEACQIPERESADNLLKRYRREWVSLAIVAVCAGVVIFGSAWK